MGIGTADDTALGKLCAFPGRNIFVLCPYSCGLSVYWLLGAIGNRHGLFEVRILGSIFRVNLLWDVEIRIAGWSLLWHCWLQLPRQTAASGTPEKQDFHSRVYFAGLRPETSEIIGQ